MLFPPFYFISCLELIKKHELYFLNLSSRNMALESTQPLREMSTRNILGDKVRPARKADNLTAICEPTV
jgi:hypothetical protein